MGRRSRKRLATPRAADPVTAVESPPVRDPHARTVSRRAGPDEAPRPPWYPFPLTELLILAGLVLMALSLAFAGDRRTVALGSGVVLACLAGLELALREHRSGYRSHSGLLGGVCGIAVLVALVLVGVDRVAALAVAVAVIVAGFWLARRAFRRRTGLGFRA